MLEGRNVVGVRKKTNIKNQVAIGRYSMTISEARDLDQNLRFPGLAAEGGMNGFAQLMDVELAGVDHRIGKAAYGLKPFALPLQIFGDALIAAQRMGSAR